MTTPPAPVGPAGSASSLSPGDQVEGYRARLGARGLVTGKLTDDDLIRFGSAACTFAAGSNSAADFDTFRSAATAQADSSLSDSDMALVIDTALVTFCPVEAARLGISA